MTVKDDASEPLDPLRRWQKEVGAIYDFVSSVPRIVFQEAGFMPMEVASRIQAEAGLIITRCDSLQQNHRRLSLLPRAGSERRSAGSGGRRSGGLVVIVRRSLCLGSRRN